MTPNISEKEQQFITQAILTLLPKAKIVFFGSRVEGKARVGSDLDLAIKESGPIPLSVLSELKEKFPHSSLALDAEGILASLGKKE